MINVAEIGKRIGIVAKSVDEKLVIFAD